MVNVKLNPNYQEILKLRFEILRPDLGSVDKCVYLGDNNPSNFHVGAESEDFERNYFLIGTATFHLETFAEKPNLKAYRLRGMATHPNHLRKGVGSKVLSFGIDECLNRGAQIIWFNARTSAIAFYESMGFQICSEEFEIVPIGPHRIMFKSYL